MKLFKYEGYNLTISEEAMLLKPFKTIWKRDKSKQGDSLDGIGLHIFYGRS